jgi:L,D-peptidoglycan transpeptidase YkuD (ErfK/YbiS/YcfS/YnhG family)
VTPEDIVITPMGARFKGRRFPCTLGRSGIFPAGKKSEGDGATPAGVHRIVGMLYRPDRLARPAGWALPIGPRDLWSDDPADEHYNHMVRAPHRFSHERLCRADPVYDLVILTGWNWPYARAGKGSAIFIHQWRRPGAPTAGCVALSRSDLHWIAPRITYRTRLIIPG